MINEDKVHMSASEFIEAWIAELAVRLKRGRYDAEGAGRRDGPRPSHADARPAGFRTFGVDQRLDAVRDARLAAAREGLRIHGWCADLTRSRLPAGFFNLVVVARYLQRDLFDTIKARSLPAAS